MAAMRARARGGWSPERGDCQNRAARHRGPGPAPLPVSRAGAGETQAPHKGGKRLAFQRGRRPCGRAPPALLAGLCPIFPPAGLGSDLIPDGPRKGKEGEVQGGEARAASRQRPVRGGEQARARERARASEKGRANRPRGPVAAAPRRPPWPWRPTRRLRPAACRRPPASSSGSRSAPSGGQGMAGQGRAGQGRAGRGSDGDGGRKTQGKGAREGERLAPRGLRARGLGEGVRVRESGKKREGVGGSPPRPPAPFARARLLQRVLVLLPKAPQRRVGVLLREVGQRSDGDDAGPRCT